MYWRNKIRDGNPEYGRLRTCIWWFQFPADSILLVEETG